MVTIVKLQLNEANNGATMRLSSRRGEVFSEEMPTDQVIVDQVAEWVTAETPRSHAGVAFFWAVVGINTKNGYHVQLDFRYRVPWKQTW